MNYYYDITLNFLENNYYFYEWNEFDDLEKVKKIPFFLISKEDFAKIYNNNIIIDKDILESILNSTITSSNNLKYALLLSDHNNTLAIEFNDEGYSICRSTLTFHDDENVNEASYSIKKVDFNYKIVGKLPDNKLRINEQIKKLLKTEVNNLETNKNITKLKYLYAEWFNEEENDLEIIKKRINAKLEGTLTEKELQIYNLIRLSYNKV